MLRETIMKMFTIGFTEKPAREFFATLRKSGTKRVIDVRLNNSSQLAGFAKKDDLAYFLREICNIDYVHIPLCAPTQEILEMYRKGTMDWGTYEIKFRGLMRERHIESDFPKQFFADACLLCSEHKPEFCHRRLVAEHLREHWGNLEIVHL